ncbi:phosphatase PAP2 family protein [Thiohalophilus sp.]|uniref:phosphatase PAP2 family protein n=1 Tax=Thiohalophilus sp. TaxID=3028392 RepID=UPI0039770804
MNWTVAIVLVILAIVVVLRLIAWWGWRLVSYLFSRLITVISQVRQRDDITALGAKFEARFPRTAGFLHARLTPDRFTGLPLTLVVIAAFYLAALFGGLVEELFEADELVRFDQWLNQQLAPLRTDGVITLFAWITDLGSSATLVAVALVTTGLLWGRSHGYMIAPLWLTLIGSQITTYTGKYVIARPRPEFITEVVALTPSFPSGHATSAMAVYGFIACILATRVAGIRPRFEIIYWAAVLIALVGFSRMLLSVHYVSDVAAGFLVGGFWLLLGFALAEHRRRLIE